MLFSVSSLFTVQSLSILFSLPGVASPQCASHSFFLHRPVCFYQFNSKNAFGKQNQPNKNTSFKTNFILFTHRINWHIHTIPNDLYTLVRRHQMNKTHKNNSDRELVLQPSNRWVRKISFIIHFST